MLGKRRSVSEETRTVQLSRTRAEAIASVACLVSVVVALAGCATTGNPDSGGAAGAIARLKPLVKQCDGPLNGFVGFDFSGSAREDTLGSEREQAVNDVALRAAACTGHVKVIAFSKSITDTAILGEADFPPSNGTMNSRLVQADKARATLINEIKNNLPAALKQVGASGTDPVGQLDLAAEYQRSRRSGALLAAFATDGLATTGPAVIDPVTFTSDEAEAKAEKTRVPNLRGAKVWIFGIGKTRKGSVKTATTQALVGFYDALCRKTGAAQCQVTTDYTTGA